MKLKKDVPGRFYQFEKNQKNANPCAIGVQLQISVPKQTYIFSLYMSCLWYSIECQTRGVPEVICAQRHSTTCMPRHNTKWLLTLSPFPRQSHKYARAQFGSQAITLFRSGLQLNRCVPLTIPKIITEHNSAQVPGEFLKLFVHRAISPSASILCSFVKSAEIV